MSGTLADVNGHRLQIVSRRVPVTAPGSEGDARWIGRVAEPATVPGTARLAGDRSLGSRLFDWLHHAAMAVTDWVLCLFGLGVELPQMWMSARWLREYECESQKRLKGI